MKFFTLSIKVAVIVAANVVAIHATEIHSKIKNGETEEAKLLIQQNPELITSKDEHKRTPLHLASGYSGTDLVEFLIENGADLNARSYNNFTPLHVCRNGSIAELLVKSGADTSLIDSWGHTALYHAVKFRMNEVAEAMISAGADVDLISAIALGKVGTAKKLVENDPTLLVSKYDWVDALGQNESPLGMAADVGNLELVKLFVDLGADVNDTAHHPTNMSGHYTPLSNAVFGGHEDVVEFLLSKGANPNVKVGKYSVDLLESVKEHGTANMISILEKARAQWSASTSRSDPS